MKSADETMHAGTVRTETTEARLGRWECLVIKGFAILFLMLFLSEKAVKEAGSIRRVWASEITAPVDENRPDNTRCQCSNGAANCPCCRRRDASRVERPSCTPDLLQ